jgi:hypothetical protein
MAARQVSTVELPAIAVEEGPVDAAWFVAVDVAKQRNHAGMRLAIAPERPMEADGVACHIGRQRQVSRVQIDLNECAAWLDAVAPDPEPRICRGRSWLFPPLRRWWCGDHAADEVAGKVESAPEAATLLAHDEREHVTAFVRLAVNPCAAPRAVDVDSEAAFSAPAMLAAVLVRGGWLA